MTPVPLESAVDLTAVASPRTLACGEVSGGNEPIHTAVELPGLRAVLYSHPCHGQRGGDVHYASVCGAGLLARVCIADVLGHGEIVAKVSSQMHAHLRRSIDVIDERRVFRDMDRRLQDMGVRAMTTAALLSSYPPSRRLTISYAGHPPGWIYVASEGRWSRFTVSSGLDPGVTVNLPLGTGFEPAYARHRQRVNIGDRLLVVTDGVLDAPNARGDDFGTAGVEAVVNDMAQHRLEAVAGALLDALAHHTGSATPQHDDVTIFIGEIVPGPSGPAVWHVLKNRLLARVVPSLR